MEKKVILELDLNENESYKFYSPRIEDALVSANEEFLELNNHIEELKETIKNLTPECDKLDYALAASSGALCGLIDIFLVGKPGESPLGEITDKWFENRTMDFAKLCGWKPKTKDKEKFSSSAISFLEEKFKIPYDQRGAGDSGSSVFDLNMCNHHFKSLGHNPTLLGLFFSILNQFTNTSHFVSNGELITLVEADGNFELQGNNVAAKIASGFINWFGHLISDVSGASGSKGRGMGIPSPIWSWSNNIIVIKRKLGIEPNKFDRDFNNLALEIYNKGYDIRFQTAQAIPVFINEIIVRLLYSVRRLVKYYSDTEERDRSFELLWKRCEPFSNATVKRMLTVAHGTFCAVDLADATIRSFLEGGGTFNSVEFFLRFNIVGVGRFSVSLYGEASRDLTRFRKSKEMQYNLKEKAILENYIKGLEVLATTYDDKDLINFVDDLQNSELYVEAFDNIVETARKRGVQEEKILHNKKEIDEYFRRDK